MAATFAYTSYFLHDHQQHKRVQEIRPARDGSMIGNAFAMFPSLDLEVMLSAHDGQAYQDKEVVYFQREMRSLSGGNFHKYPPAPVTNNKSNKVTKIKMTRTKVSSRCPCL